MNETQQIQKLRLPTIYGLIFMKWENISHFESNDNYSILVETNGNKLTITKSLKWLETHLEKQCCFRIHRGYLINLENIKQYHGKGNGQLIMESGTIIPISRTSKTKIHHFLKL